MAIESAAENLKQFLVLLPERLHYQKDLVEINLFRCLYFAITDNGKYLKDVISDYDSKRIPKTWDDIYTVFNTVENKFYTHSDSVGKKYSHQTGQPCSRHFKDGEPIYRCLECSYDETCVLCVHCYNKEDHRGHDVRVSTSKGEGGGICDCGDPEAFVNELNCKCSISQASLEHMESQFVENLKPIIDVCMDYILDVMNYSVQPIPFIHDSINSNNSFLTSQNLSEYSNLSEWKYGVQDTNSSEYLLVLWNDEIHTYDDANSRIIGSLGCNEVTAHHIADVVDKVGRFVLKVGKNPSELYETQRIVESSGLVSTIISTRDYVRECMVHVIFEWLMQITDDVYNIAFRDKVKLTISESLLEGFQFSKPFVNSFLESIPTGPKSLSQVCFESGLLYNGELVNGGLVMVKPAPDLSGSIADVLTTNPSRELSKSRVQYILLFDIRFWKSLRNKLYKFITPLLVDTKFKKEYCIQLAEIYPHLITTMALTDREADLHVINEMTTQVFTCPTSVATILDEGLWGRIVGPALHLVREHLFDSNTNSFRTPRRVDIGLKLVVPTLTRDLMYIIENCIETSVLFRSENLILILCYFQIYQNFYPITRKYGEHVEHEPYEYFMQLQWVLTPLKIMKAVTDGDIIGDDRKRNLLIKNAIFEICKYLGSQNIKSKTVEGEVIMDYKVSKEPGSFIHPIDSFLSALIENYQFNDFEFLAQVAPSFLTISDNVMRTLGLYSQIKIGAWVRNGFTISRIATLYAEGLMSQVTFGRDIHLTQVQALVGSPKQFLFNMLDRFELLDWFLNVETFHGTIYQDRIGYLVEEFISFSYRILTNRVPFSGLSFKEKNIIRMRDRIIYGLCREPQPFSNLVDSFSELSPDDPSVEAILDETAVFTPPTEISDTGIYRLKLEVYDELDPLSMCVDSADFHDFSESISRNVARRKGTKEDNVIIQPNVRKLEPEFSKLGAFTKISEFAKLIYKFMQCAIDDEEESYLAHLLHLIHAILIDDEHIHGDEYLTPSFVNIPISNLLLTISESTMAKSIVKKAEFLLNSFITKETAVMESLIDAFGEEHMKEYKQRKKSVFETDSEKRKRLANERREKVMKKFAKQQAKFMENHKDLEESEDMEAQNEDDDDSRICIVCGNPESIDNIFGLPAFIGKSSAFWQLPYHDIEHTSAAFKDWNEIQEGESEIGHGFSLNETNEQHFGSSIKDRYVATSCGHGMHYNCFREYKRTHTPASQQEYACPLCRSAHNSFIPVFPSPKTTGGFDANFEPQISKYNQISGETEGANCHILSPSLFSPEFCDALVGGLSRLRILETITKILKSNPFLTSMLSISTNYFANIQGLSILIGNTIASNEITARLSGNMDTDGILNDIPNSSTDLIKALIQFRVFLTVFKKDLVKEYNEMVEYKKFWDTNNIEDGIFAEMTLLFFQTNESFKTISRLSLTKLFTVVCYSLCLRAGTDHGQLKALKGHSTQKRSKDEIELLRKFVSRNIIDSINDVCTGAFLEGLKQEDLSDEFLNELGSDTFICDLYHAIERCLLPFLRQVYILRRMLPETSESAMEMSSGSNDDSEVVILLHRLNLPLVSEIINAVCEKTTTFERHIYENVIDGKIPKFLYEGILSIEYPGMVRLIQLPENLSSLSDYEVLEDSKNKHVICLHCGARPYKYKTNTLTTHMTKCCKNVGIFFSPRENILNIFVQFSPNKIHSLQLGAPYLTKHGEVKIASRRGDAFLNHMRYKYLTKLWLNQGLIGYVSRMMVNARRRQQQVNLGVDIDSDEEIDGIEGLNNFTVF